MRTYSLTDTLYEQTDTLTLHLHDDGTFTYDTYNRSYAGSSRSNASGRWSQENNTVELSVERSTDSSLQTGRTYKAIEEKGKLKLTFMNFPSLELQSPPQEPSKPQ